MATGSVLNVIYLGLEPFDESYLWLTTEFRFQIDTSSLALDWPKTVGPRPISGKIRSVQSKNNLGLIQSALPGAHNRKKQTETTDSDDSDVDDQEVQQFLELANQMNAISCDGSEQDDFSEMQCRKWKHKCHIADIRSSCLYTCKNCKH